MRIFRRLLLADPSHSGVSVLGGSDIPARRSREHQVWLRGASPGRISVLIVPGAIDHQRDILVALQELFEHAAVEQDITVQNQTTASQLGLGAEQ